MQPVRAVALVQGQQRLQRLWHVVDRGCVRFVVLALEFRRPARAELAIAFPLVTDEVGQVLSAAASIGWLTIGDITGEFVMVMAPVVSGLAECLSVAIPASGVES